MTGGQTASINGEMHWLKIVKTVARYPTRLLVFMDRINFLSVIITSQMIVHFLHNCHQKSIIYNIIKIYKNMVKNRPCKLQEAMVSVRGLVNYRWQWCQSEAL